MFLSRTITYFVNYTDGVAKKDQPPYCDKLPTMYYKQDRFDSDQIEVLTTISTLFSYYVYSYIGSISK